MWWTLIALGMRVLFSILSDCRFFSWSSKQHSPLLLSHSDSISEGETEEKKNFDLPRLSPKIKDPVCLRRTNKLKCLSSCFPSWKLWDHTPAWLYHPAAKRTVRLWCAEPDSRLVSSRLVSSMRAGGLLSVFHHHNHFSYRKKESRVLRIPRRGR